MVIMYGPGAKSGLFALRVKRYSPTGWPDGRWPTTTTLLLGM
jgi:hypothetical protein